jgi:hypothetical protein
VSVPALQQILGPLLEALAEQWQQEPSRPRPIALADADEDRDRARPDRGAAEERLHGAARELREAVAGELRERLDRLGGTVFLQARCVRPRQRGNADDICAFYGMHDARCRTRGLIFTSARLDPAIESLAADHGIVLIDRERLIGLMIQHGIGVSNETIRIPRVDRETFDSLDRALIASPVAA